MDLLCISHCSNCYAALITLQFCLCELLFQSLLTIITSILICIILFQTEVIFILALICILLEIFIRSIYVQFTFLKKIVFNSFFLL